MSWKKSTIGDVLSVIKNGINCEQNKNPVGNKITRIETIAKKRFDFERVGYANLSEAEKLKSQLKVGDILFSHINSPIHVGKTAIYEGEENIYHGINLLLMRTKEEIDPYFFNHFLNHLFTTGYWEENCKKSVNQASVNQKDISKVQFNYPPLPTQQTIVAKLDAIFAEIDKATAAAEANAKNAEALFQSYLNQVFESNNDGWTKKSLPSLCTLFNGRAYSKSELLDSGKYTVLRVGNFFTNEHWYYSDLELEENKYCDNGDLLYAWSASFGPRIWSGDKVIYHYHIWKVVPHSDVIDKMFLFYLLEWDVDKIKKDHGTGATMIHVSKKSMESRVLPYVDLESQRSIVLRLDSMKNYTKNLKSQYNEKVKVLSDYKKSILRNAFNGEFIKD